MQIYLEGENLFLRSQKEIREKRMSSTVHTTILMVIFSMQHTFSFLTNKQQRQLKTDLTAE